MKGNAYFEDLDRIAREYEQRHQAHKALKEQIIREKGWDSDELNQWYAEEERDFKYPISAGACKAFRAWRESQGDEVIMGEFTWDRERHDFIETLRKAGQESFVVVNQSTGLMEDIHGYAAEGCTMEGLCTVRVKKHRWGEDEEETILGIRFRL